MADNLIPNGDFAAGLEGWESSPSGVTLFCTPRKRFLMLAGQATAAAVLSSPIRTVPGARYKLTKQVAVVGYCEVEVRDAAGTIDVEPDGEWVASSDEVRVQVSSPSGEKVGISEVKVVPVGKRLEFRCVRDTYALEGSGEEFRIVAELTNSGSEPIRHAKIRLVPTTQKLAEEHKSEQVIESISVGEILEVSWKILGQSTAVSPYKIELDYGGGSAVSNGITLRHRPRLPSVKTTKSAFGSRRVVSIANRGLRLTAHETDLDMGPLHVYDERLRVQLGVASQIAQLRTPTKVIPLWAVYKRSAPSSVELFGKSELGEWVISCNAEHYERGIGFELRLRLRRRLANVHLEMVPFATVWKSELAADGSIRLESKDGVCHLNIARLRGEPLSLIPDDRVGLYVLRSKLMNLAPSANLRAAALIKLL